MTSSMEQNDRSKVEVDSVEPLTPRTRAILEVGKVLLLDSIDTGREFCKFMVTAPIGAIPVYLALAGLLFPDHYRPDVRDAVVLLVPPVVLLISTVVAALGYVPRHSVISVEILEEIEDARNKLIFWRRRLGLLAFELFLLGIIWAIADIAFIVYGVIGPNAAE